MIKLVYCIRRRADLTADAFREYWLHHHAPLVAKHAAALQARRYVQSHTIDPETNALLRGSRSSGEPFDGITEMWWDDTEALASALGSDDGRRAGAELLEDERNFIDFARSSLFVSEEHAIFGD